MCAADTTLEWPLYTREGFGSDGPITGEKIPHVCRDWDAIKEFGIANGELKHFDWKSNS